jgi:hypothetical protein
MVNTVVILLFRIVSPNLVLAHLGQDADRVEDDYGPLIQRHLFDDGTVSVTFHQHKNPYLYVVLFDQGMSVSEKMSRVDGRELTEKEIANFLKANAARAKWRKMQESSDKEKRRFERSDHRAEATYGKIDGVPTLMVRGIKGE